MDGTLLLLFLCTAASGSARPGNGEILVAASFPIRMSDLPARPLAHLLGQAEGKKHGLLEE
jgi:hypothetical protein